MNIYDVAETLQARDDHNFAHALPPVVEAFRVASEAKGGGGISVTESFVAHDTIIGASGIPATDTFYADDSADTYVTGGRNIIERFRVRSSVRTHSAHRYDVHETLRAGGAVSAARPPLDAGERFYAHSSAHTAAAISLRESFRADDSVRTGSGTALAETFRARDDYRLSGGLTVTEALRADDSYALLARYTIDAGEGFYADDSVQYAHSAHYDVHERFHVYSEPLLTAAGVAWTANTVTFGMSRYEDFPYESLAGRFAAGQGGVYLRDEALPVSWRIATGEMDLGSSHRKRLGWIYLDGTRPQTEPLTLGVSADVRGMRIRHEYTQMPREADNDRLVRATTGKGFLSNRYVIDVSASCSFMLTGGEIEAFASTRRI